MSMPDKKYELCFPYYSSEKQRHLTYLCSMSTGKSYSMARLHILVILVSFVPPSLSVYLGQIIPKYYLPYVLRSDIPKPVPRSAIPNPELSRLYAAKRQAIKIAKDIDAEIEHVLQDQLYRRNFDASQYDPNNLPFFNPSPTNPLSAAIGVQGGAWFPGPSGAGVEGSRMLEGHTSQFSSAQASRRQSQTGLTGMLQVPQMVHEKQFPRTFTPTATQTTPDPSDEINSEQRYT